MKVIFAVALGAVLMVIVVLMISTRSPGNALVYDRIEASTSCTELEIEFDAVVGIYRRAEIESSQREVFLSYAQAAMARMTHIGCP